MLVPLIPRAVTEQHRAEDRLVINGMVDRLRTGIAWRDLSERCG
ncbi:transposase [Streptomyces sp. CMB-StM0423]|nr:hypothetical protein CXR04_04700 [Streptomyces sp. CMB-StM0423]